MINQLSIFGEEAKRNGSHKQVINQLPIIIPLVIYHGKDAWNIKSTLGEMIYGYDELPEDVKKYLPDYEYVLYDLSKYTDEQIKGEVQLRILITILRDIFIKDNAAIRETVLRAAEHLRELDDKQSGIEYFETFMRYILNAGQRLTKEDIDEIIHKVEKTYPEGSEVVMTLAERFREEGKIEGIQEGFKEGETKALLKTAIRLLTKRFGALTEDTRSKMDNLDAVTLEIIIDEILEYKSLEDVKKYLK